MVGAKTAPSPPSGAGPILCRDGQPPPRGAKPPTKGRSGVAHTESLYRRHSRSQPLRRPVDPAGLVDLIADRR